MKLSLTANGPTIVSIDWHNVAAPVNLTEGLSHDYNGWPDKTVFYDSANDQLNVIQTSGAVHNESGTPANYDKVPYCHRLENAGSEVMDSGNTNNFEAPVAMFSPAVNISSFTQSACLLGNGNYGSIVAQTLSPDFWSGNNSAPATQWVTSSDQGATWSNTDLVDGGASVIPSSYTMHMTRLSSGRLLACTPVDCVFLSTPRRFTLQVIYSDNGGTSWTRGASLRFDNTIETAHDMDWEPTFCELSDGRIVVIARTNTGEYTGRADRKMAVGISSDSGLTFSRLKNICSFSSGSNPCDIQRLPTGHWLGIFGSRTEGQSGLYAALSTDRMISSGKFGPMQKIIEGSNDSDFGYPGFAHDGKNRLWCAYYAAGPIHHTDTFLLKSTISYN